MSQELVTQSESLDNLGNQAQKVHNALQQAAKNIGAPINTVVINNETLYQSENNQNFSLTGEGIHYQQQNGLVQVVIAQQNISLDQQTTELQAQTQLNQTERAFFNGESQGNTSRRESNLRLSNNED